MITIIGITGEETEAQMKEFAWAMFCKAHPVEAYQHAPEKFLDFAQTQMPGVGREILRQTIEELAAEDSHAE